MPSTTLPLPTGYICGRIPGKLRKRIDDAIKVTNQKDSALLRAALDEFLTKHSTPDKIIAAVVASVRREEEAG